MHIEAQNNDGRQQKGGTSSDITGSTKSKKMMSDAEIRALAAKKSTPLSLANMYRYASSDVHTGQRLRNAQFLHRELPIRLAQVIFVFAYYMTQYSIAMYCRVYGSGWRYR